MINQLGIEIEDHLFQGNEKLTCVTIPSSIKRIGKNSFHGCSSLRQIIFEKESLIELIDDYSFLCCPLLSQISIPNSLKTIGRSAFDHCISLSNLKIEESSQLESIYFNSFNGCKIFVDEETNKKLKSIIHNFSNKTFILSSEQNILIPFYKRIYPKYDDKNNYISFFGHESVGKTSVISRFKSKEFDELIPHTIGMDSYIVGSLKIVDMSGQEAYFTLFKRLFYQSDIIVIFFDISKRSSFDSLIDFKEFLDDVHFAQFILVGNKCDLNREVSKEEAENIASKYGLNYFEVSAKTGFGVDELFNYINSEREIKDLYGKIEYEPPCNDDKNDSSHPKCSIF